MINDSRDTNVCAFNRERQNVKSKIAVSDTTEKRQQQKSEEGELLTNDTMQNENEGRQCAFHIVHWVNEYNQETGDK